MAIGFLALLTVPISEIRSIGVAGFLVAGICVLLTNTLVPAVLGLLGRRIDGADAVYAEAGCKRAGADGQNLAALGTCDRRASVARTDAGRRRRCCCWRGRRRGWIPAFRKGTGCRSRRNRCSALHELEKMDRAGVVYSLRVIIELPEESIAQTDAGWDCDRSREETDSTSDPRCDRVISITTSRMGIGLR